MNYKIICVSNENVSVASDDGTFFNISVSELDFTPKIGDKVNVFVNGDKRIVSKIDLLGTNAGNVNGNSTKPVFDNEISNRSKTAMIVVGSIIGLFLFVMLCICVYFAEDSSSTDGYEDEYEDGYEDGYDTGFMMGDLDYCDHANISYTIKYGAPRQSEKNHYNNYKEAFMKGCVDGIRAHDQ